MATQPFNIPVRTVQPNSPQTAGPMVVEGLTQISLSATLTVQNPQSTHWTAAQATNVTVDPQHQDWTDETNTTLGPWISFGPTTWPSGQLTHLGNLPGLSITAQPTENLLMHHVQVVVSVDKAISIGFTGQLVTTP